MVRNRHHNSCEHCHGNYPNCPICGQEPAMRTCPDCEGIGYRYYIFNEDTNEVTECTEEEYSRYPNERLARITNKSIYGLEPEVCERCEGRGEIEKVYDFDKECIYDL